MVLGVLNQAFDVLVLRYGVQKRIYCNVSAGAAAHGQGCSGQTEAGYRAQVPVYPDLYACATRLLPPPPQTHRAVST